MTRTELNKIEIAFWKGKATEIEMSKVFDLAEESCVNKEYESKGIEDKLLERYKNLLELKQDVYYEDTIVTRYTEHDLKEIIWLLGDYKAIKNAYGSEDKQCQ